MSPRTKFKLAVYILAFIVGAVCTSYLIDRVNPRVDEWPITNDH